MSQPSILAWIDTKDGNLKSTIEFLSLDSAVGPGVTFLYPENEEFRKYINELAYSDQEEATKIIRSLIIPDVLLHGVDFRRPVGNELGVKFDTELTTGDRVTITNSTDGSMLLSKPKDFTDQESAVWVFASGRPPLKGEPYKRPDPKTGEARKKYGGASAPSNSFNNRQHLALHTERDFDRCMRDPANRCRTHHPYIAKMVNLLSYLQKKYADIYLKVLPIIDFDPVVSFYLVLEPYKTQGEYLIPDDVLFGEDRWNGTDFYTGNVVNQFKGMFNSLPQQTDVSLVFRDRAAVTASVDIVRRQVNGTTVRTQLPAAVQSAYTSFVSKNSIDGKDGIFPDSTLAALANGKKLWQDEFRFIVHAALTEVYSLRDYRCDLFANIIDDIRFKWPGDNYDTELMLSNVNDIKTNVNSRSDLLLLVKFVNSTDFLYASCSVAAVGPISGSMHHRDATLYNRSAVAVQRLEHTSGMLRADISNAATAELTAYMQSSGGKLPPKIEALMAKST